MNEAIDTGIGGDAGSAAGPDAITIVTAHIDIGRTGWRWFARSDEAAFAAFDGLAALANPMVVYTQPQHVDRIRAIRDGHGHGQAGATTVVALADWMAGSEDRYEAVHAIVRDPAWEDAVANWMLPKAWHPAWVLRSLLAPALVAHAFEAGLVGTRLAAWVDADYAANPRRLGGLAEWRHPFDPDRLTLFAHHAADLDRPIRDVVLSGDPTVAGSVIVGGCDAWIAADADCADAVDALLADGLSDDLPAALALASRANPGGYRIERLPASAGFGDAIRLYGSPAPDPSAETTGARGLLRSGYQALADAERWRPADPDFASDHVGTESALGPFWTRPGDLEIGETIRRTGVWGEGEMDALRGLLRPGMTVLDVGANIGFLTVWLSRQVGHAGRVLAVEPEPRNRETLRGNLRLSGADNVEVLPLAAGAGPGIARMTWIGHNPGASFATPGASGPDAVEIVALDDALDPDAPVHLVKIDVQGMDHLVVEGLRDTIARWRPLLLVEFDAACMGTAGEDPREALDLYRMLGLDVHLEGADLLALAGRPGFAVEEWVRRNLLVRPEDDRALVAATLSRGVNLVLRPRPGRP